jgi:hypothetical protein
MDRAEHSPVPLPLPQMGSPSRPQALGGPETYSGKETAHLGPRLDRLYSGASRAGAALARRPPLLPHLPPRLPAPTREQFFRGIWAGRTLPGGASRRRDHLHSPRGPSHIRRNAHPPRPPVPGHVGPALTQQLYRTTLETLHKHLETRLKIMAHHPKIYKTSNELILQEKYAIRHQKR